MAVQRSRVEPTLLAGRHGAVDGRSITQDKDLLTAATTAAHFGSQMVNCPLPSRTSRYLLGGALVAALLGPALGVVASVTTVVVVVQARVFVDGGLTAIGPDVLLLAAVGTLVG